MATLQVGTSVYPKMVALRDGTKVMLRPLEATDKLALFRFFQHVPEDERYYLKENVASPETICEWTAHIDHERAIPIVALDGDAIVADATLHRSRAPARRCTGEIRIVVGPAYRERGLGRRLIREMVDLAADLGLHKVTMELVEHRERAGIMAAYSVGFRPVATLQEWARDAWGNLENLVILELPVEERALWWRF